MTKEDFLEKDFFFCVKFSLLLGTISEKFNEKYFFDSHVYFHQNKIFFLLWEVLSNNSELLSIIDRISLKLHG